MTSKLNVALARKLRGSLVCLACIFRCVTHGCFYNQALEDVRSTGAGIKGLYGTSRLCINPIMLAAAKKQPDNFGKNLAGKSKVVKIFDGEMSMSTFLTTLLQIFCTIIFKSEVIVKSIPDPDVNFWSVKL